MLSSCDWGVGFPRTVGLQSLLGWTVCAMWGGSAAVFVHYYEVR